MRKHDLLFSLLREMAEEPDGQIIAVATMGMSEQESERRHHVEILVDAGHAVWNPQGSMARITNSGYDFIEAVDKGRGVMEMFNDLMEKGIPYVQAAQAVLNYMSGHN